MKLGTNLIAVTALLALGATAALACPLAYAINFSGEFGVIDLATGVFTPLTALENTPDGLGGAPGGPFYTVDAVTGHLLKLGLDGKITDVGDTHTGPNIGPNGVSLVGSLTDGTLYALDFSNRLHRVNKDTGALTLLGTLSSLPKQENEYIGNMTTSLNGNATTLFYTVEILEGENQVDAALYTINPATLAVTKRPLKLPGRAIGSGVVNGSLYLFTEVGPIMKVDPNTAEATIVSEYETGLTEDTPPLTGIFGVIGAPEPFTLSDHTNATKTNTTRKPNKNWPPKFAPPQHRVH